MSFGKRGANTPERGSPRSRQQGLETSNARQSWDDESDEGPDFVLYSAAFIAVAAFVVIYLKLNPSEPSRVETAGEPAPIVTSDVAPLDTIRQRMTTGEDGRTFDFAIIASPAARCFARLNSVRPWRHPGWTNRAVDEARGILKFEYEVAGLAMNCLMTEDRNRFCKAEERAKISKAVSFYVSKYRRDAAAKQRASAAPETPRGQMYKDLAGRMNAMDPGGNDDDKVDDAALLFAGVENVTASGYFTAADFGASPPPELASHIRQPLSKPCG